MGYGLKNRVEGKKNDSRRMRKGRRGYLAALGLDQMEPRMLMSGNFLHFSPMDGFQEAGDTTSFSVAVTDVDGDPVAFNGNVTVHVFEGPDATPQQTVQATNGSAIFNIQLTKAGDYTFVATDDSGDAVDFSENTDVEAGFPTQALITQQPGSFTAGGNTSLGITLEDQYGNVSDFPVPDFAEVSLASGCGTLTGNTFGLLDGGGTTFSGLSLTQAGNYTLQVNTEEFGTLTSNSFTVSAGAASQAVITQQPGSFTAGGNTSLGITLEDQYGNVSDFPMPDFAEVSLASGCGTLTGNTFGILDGGGTTFSGLSLTQAGNYTLRVNTEEFGTLISNPFTVSAGAASQAVITQQPGNFTAGGSTSLGITIEDQFGNPTTDPGVDTASITVSGDATLLGTTGTSLNSSGQTTINPLTMLQAGNFTLTAQTSEFGNVTSDPFTVSAGEATRVAITSQTGNVTAGGNITVTAAVEDFFGNVVTSDNSLVDLSLDSEGTLSGCTSVQAVNGVATFTGLSIQQAGDYQLAAIDDASAMVFPGFGDTFTVSPDVASQIVFTTQPTGVTAGAPINVTASLEDQFGNVETGDNSTNMSIAFTNATHDHLVFQSSQVVNGSATVTGTGFTVAGNYTLTAAAGELSGDSDSFVVSANAPQELLVTTQPGNFTAYGNTTMTVQLADSFGNPINSGNATLTASIETGNGTLSGNVTATEVNGVATFTGLSISRAGNYTLSVTDGDITTDTDSFTVAANTATHIAWGTVANVGGCFTMTAKIEDAQGNVVLTDNGNVTLTKGVLSTGTVSGNMTVAAVNGVATFGFAAIKPGTLTLTATQGELTSAATGSFTIGAKLVLKQTLPATTAGATLTGLVVFVEDASGHVLTTDNSAVTIALATGPDGGELNGNVTVNAVNGVATFTGVSIDTAGVYTMTATDGQVTDGLSHNFTINAGAVASLQYVQQPGVSVGGTQGVGTPLPTVTAGTAISPAITVEALDQFGNLVKNASGSVSLSVGFGINPNILINGSGQLEHNLTSGFSNGIATFKAAAIDVAGDYQLKATYKTVTLYSHRFLVGAAAASKLAFVAAPTTSVAGASTIETIDVEDKFGNIILNNTQDITLSLKTAPKGVSISGELDDDTADGGEVEFNESILPTTAGNYTMTATATGLKAAVTGTIAVTPAAAAKLVFTTEPKSAKANKTLSAINVSVEDAFGNVVTTNTSMVTLAVTGGGNVFSGTTATAAVKGVATFSTLKLAQAGNVTLTASDALLTTAISSPFLITA